MEEVRTNSVSVSVGKLPYPSGAVLTSTGRNRVSGASSSDVPKGTGIEVDFKVNTVSVEITDDRIFSRTMVFIFKEVPTFTFTSGANPTTATSKRTGVNPSVFVLDYPHSI